MRLIAARSVTNRHLLIHQRRYIKRLISAVGGVAEWGKFGMSYVRLFGIFLHPGRNRDPCGLLYIYQCNAGIDDLIHKVWVLVLPGTALFSLGTYILHSWM